MRAHRVRNHIRRPPSPSLFGSPSMGYHFKNVGPHNRCSCGQEQHDTPSVASPRGVAQCLGGMGREAGCAMALVRSRHGPPNIDACTPLTLLLSLLSSLNKLLSSRVQITDTWP